MSAGSIYLKHGSYYGRWLTADDAREPDFAAEIARRLPTGELATVEQVADPTRHLACDASWSVSGAILRIDGGWTAW